VRAEALLAAVLALGARAPVLAASAPGAAERDRCRREFSMETLVANLDKGVPAELEAGLGRIKQAALNYYTCRAWQAKDNRLCAKHPNFDEHHFHWDVVCKAHYNEMTLIRSLMSGDPGFEKLCPPTLAETAYWEEKEFREEDLPKVCAIVRRDYTDPKKACAQLNPLFIDEGAKRKCERVIGRLNGEPGSCEQFSTPLIRGRCLEYARYKAAAPAKDPSRCADSAICRVFLGGGPAACEAYARPIVADVCDASPMSAVSASTAAARVVQGYSPEALVSAVKQAGGLPSDLAPHVDVLVRPLMEYFQCAAFARDDRKACLPLASLNMPSQGVKAKENPEAHWDMACEGHYNEMELVRSYATGGAEFKTVCPRALALAEEFEEREFKVEEIPRVCEILDAERDIDRACKKLRPMFTTDHLREKCEVTFKRLAAEPDACRSFKQPEVAERCLEYAAFKRAWAAKDPSLCAGSTVCGLFFDRDERRCKAYADAAERALLSRPDAAEAAAKLLQRERPVCDESRSLDEVARALAETGAELTPELGWAAIDYFRCAAVADRDAGRCRPLLALDAAAKGFNAPLDDFCLSNYNETALGRALMTGEHELARVCEHSSKNSKEFKPGTVARACAVVEARRGDLKAMCAELQPFFAGAKEAARCEGWLGAFYEGFDCSQVANPHRRGRCADYAAFRSAWAKRDSESCGGSVICRAMMSGGEAVCAESAAKFRAAACAAATGGKGK
jgi:hypothetical protein